MNHVRLPCALVAIALAATLLSCTKTSARPKSPDATLTLALRAGTYADVIKNCLPAFEAEHNVLCTVLELTEEGLHADVAGDSQRKTGAYDLCMVDGSWMAEYTAKGVLANLSELGYALDDDIIPATTAICYKNGGLYLAPYYGNVTVLLYNKLMVKEAGLRPEDIRSIEDIKYVCAFQKKRHNLGFMYRGDTANNLVVDFLPILLSYGGWVVDDNNNPTVDSSAFVKAMYAYLDLIGTGRAAKKDDVVTLVYPVIEFFDAFQIHSVHSCLCSIFPDLLRPMIYSSSSATACAAIPSPSPVKPSFSSVVAFTLTRSSSTCITAASRAFISGI